MIPLASPADNLTGMQRTWSTLRYSLIRETRASNTPYLHTPPSVGMALGGLANIPIDGRSGKLISPAQIPLDARCDPAYNLRRGII